MVVPAVFVGGGGVVANYCFSTAAVVILLAVIVSCNIRACGVGIVKQ